TYEEICDNLIENKNKFLIEKEAKWIKLSNDLWSEESLKKVMDKIQKEHLIKKKAKKMQTCPICGKAGLSERKIKKPRYRCIKCGKEFSKPIHRIPSHYYMKNAILKNRAEEIINTIIKNKVIEQFYNEINRLYQKEVDKSVAKYLFMTDTFVLCKECHYAVEKGMVLCPKCKKHYIYPHFDCCINCQNDHFFEQNRAYYIIEKSKNHFIIRSIYDKTLVKIIKEGLWYGKKWDNNQKIWSFEKISFCQIQKRLLDYLASTGKQYNLKFVEERIYHEVKEALSSNKNYREKLLVELPKCNDEMEGFCNQAGEFLYGERIKCNKLYCDGYFSISEDYDKLAELITKIHLVDNKDILLR
ncbi:MAG: hypothetical protein ACFFAT_22230, partial [Promethearchaeota archaeon]